MQEYCFYTESVEATILETKSGKKYYVEGYASTPDLDLVNDVVSDQALQSMLAQLKGRNIKLDVEHESWVKGGSPNILPIGKIIDAEIKEKKLWIKAELNQHTSRFQEVWGSIQDRFYDAFSIAFTNVKAIEKRIANKAVRVIQDLDLLNIALTGNPANPNARMTAVFAKSREHAIISKEEKTMEEENTPAPEVKNASAEELQRLESQISELKNTIAQNAASSALAETKSAEQAATIEQLTAQVKSLAESLNKIDIKSQPTEQPVPNSRSVANPLDLFKVSA